MALNNTIGDADANCYPSLVEANAYFVDRAHAEAWEEVENQTQMLITASSQIDWYITWKGSRVTGTQSMDWPRSGVYDKVGELYSEDVIPKDVKVAVYELALSSFDGDRTSDGDLSGLSEVKAGSLMIKTDDGMYSTKPDTIPSKIWKILEGLTVKSGIGVVRLVRA